MKTFDYTITAENGMHARPAGALVSLCKTFDDEITLEKDGKKADGKRLLSVMGLCIRYDDKVKVYVQGETEERALEELWNFFIENL